MEDFASRKAMNSDLFNALRGPLATRARRGSGLDDDQEHFEFTRLRVQRVGNARRHDYRLAGLDRVHFIANPDMGLALEHIHHGVAGARMAAYTSVGVESENRDGQHVLLRQSQAGNLPRFIGNQILEAHRLGLCDVLDQLPLPDES